MLQQFHPINCPGKLWRVRAIARAATNDSLLVPSAARQRAPVFPPPPEAFRPGFNAILFL